MASIYLGVFRGYSNNDDAGAYNCYLKYDSISRSGNKVTIKNLKLDMTRISDYYTTNRIAIKAGYNGSENNIKNNATINAAGSNSAASYSISLGSPSVNTNDNGFKIYINIQSTGWNDGWTNFVTNGLIYNQKKLSDSSASPVAPSKPSAINIPSSAAPDQTITINWNASSGGSNGVTGYRLAYSKDGGSTWTYEIVTTTNKSLNLNDLGFKHGSILKCAVQSYSKINNVDYFSDYIYSSNVTTNFVAPSAPSTINIPSSIAPDKVATISWTAASGGTNGVKGYEWQWSNDGGNTWPASLNTTAISGTVNLNSNGFKHGSKLMARVRAYTIGQEDKYYSSWKTSGTTITNFIAPSAPRSVALSTDMEEPIPTGTYKGTWLVPSTTGSNGVSGYRIQWLKNGSNLGSEVDINSTSTTKTLTETDIKPGDILSFKTRAYTIGQNTRYYSDYTASTSLEIVSDKFIYLSANGGSFNKYKAYISVNGGSFKEIKKEKLKIIK